MSFGPCRAAQIFSGLRWHHYNRQIKKNLTACPTHDEENQQYTLFRAWDRGTSLPLPFPNAKGLVFSQVTEELLTALSSTHPRNYDLYNVHVHIHVHLCVCVCVCEHIHIHHIHNIYIYILKKYNPYIITISDWTSVCWHGWYQCTL